MILPKEILFHLNLFSAKSLRNQLHRILNTRQEKEDEDDVFINFLFLINSMSCFIFWVKLSSEKDVKKDENSEFLQQKIFNYY